MRVLHEWLHVHTFSPLYVAENPVTVPRVDAEQAWVPTTNTQFEYENIGKLDKALQHQYGEVNSRLGKCHIFSIEPWIVLQ